MFGWLSNLFAKPKPRGRSLRLMKRHRELGAAYDAAQTTEFNARHWQNADTLSAQAANSYGVRKTLRSRSRYEALESNSFAKGIVHTLANDVVGTGPRLQMLTPNREANSRIEAAFHFWSRLVKLAKKLRTMRIAKCIDGETFALFVNNPSLPFVQLDLRLIEADQITTPTLFLEDVGQIDGIRFDEFGNPTEYHLLKQHPGDDVIGFNPFDFDRLPAEAVIHLFHCDRPGQLRGVPEITTALPLFAQLRRYTLAVLGSAETAAKMAAVLETDSGAHDDDGNDWDPDVSPFDVVDIDFDMMTSLPFGWHMRQFKAEQPTTTYEMFRNAILNEIARCVHMPFNIAAGNSSAYNYASGRLDHQTYFKAIDVERSDWEIDCLDRILSAWFDEAVFIPGLIPAGLGPLEELPHQWFWDGREHVDPQKEAGGQQVRIQNGTTTRGREYARMGLDIDVEDEKAAAEFGVTLEEYRQGLFSKHFGGGGAAPMSEDDSTHDPENEETNGDESEEAAETAAAA